MSTFKKGMLKMKQTKMKRVTKNNLLILISWIERYNETNNIELKKDINNFIDNVINNDDRYFSKLLEYNFNNDQLKYLI